MRSREHGNQTDCFLQILNPKATLLIFACALAFLSSFIFCFLFFLVFLSLSSPLCSSFPFSLATLGPGTAQTCTYSALAIMLLLSILFLSLSLSLCFSRPLLQLSCLIGNPWHGNRTDLYIQRTRHLAAAATATRAQEEDQNRDLNTVIVWSEEVGVGVVMMMMIDPYEVMFSIAQFVKTSLHSLREVWRAPSFFIRVLIISGRMCHCVFFNLMQSVFICSLSFQLLSVCPINPYKILLSFSQFACSFSCSITIASFLQAAALVVPCVFFAVFVSQLPTSIFLFRSFVFSSSPYPDLLFAFFFLRSCHPSCHFTLSLFLFIRVGHYIPIKKTIFFS